MHRFDGCIPVMTLRFWLARSATVAPFLAVALPVAMTAAQADTVYFNPAIGSYGSAIAGGIDNSACSSAGDFFTTNGAMCFFSSSQGSGVASNLSDNATSSSASAVASLSQGYVSASATGTSFTHEDVGGDVPGAAIVHALIWDTLTFEGASPGAVATIIMSGLAERQNQSDRPYFTDQNAVVTATALLLAPDGLPNLIPALLAGNDATFEPGGPYTLPSQYAISNGVPMWLAVAVTASAGGGGACPSFGPCLPMQPEGEASINDPFTLDLPAGVTVTSAGPIPLTPVPEPGTLALLLTSLIGTAAARRRG